MRTKFTTCRRETVTIGSRLQGNQRYSEFTLTTVDNIKGTGHNKFVRRGSTLLVVGGLSKTPPILRTLLQKFYWL